MKLKILFFGITTDLIGTSSTVESFADETTVFDLKNSLLEKFPKLKNISSYAIAVNESYATDEQVLFENDIIAVIPPVSGG